VSIFKKGNKNEASNYRPVSLTSVPCKILESIIKDAVVEQLEQQGFYTDCQYGFEGSFYANKSILETLESWTRILEEGFGVDVIYLDYRKAFDTVPHWKLLYKLKKLGLGVLLITWIEQFLLGGDDR